eukprot:UN28037
MFYFTTNENLNDSLVILPKNPLCCNLISICSVIKRSENPFHISDTFCYNHCQSYEETLYKIIVKLFNTEKCLFEVFEKFMFKRVSDVLG